MSRSLFIRVDGDASGGLGHFYRCLALAEFIEEHFKIIFVSKNINPDLVKRVEEKYQFFKIEKENDFFSLVSEKAIVVVDGYQFDQTFFQKLKTEKVKIVSVQDIKYFSDNIDLVINHLPGAEKNYENVEVLSGPEYAVIRKKILKSPLLVKREEGYLISLGGTENYLIINKIIKLIKQLEEKAVIKVLTTQTNSEHIINEGVEIYKNQDEEALLELIDSSKNCLITSGMISYEVLARNKKAVVGALNEGQSGIGEEFCRMGLVEYIGYWRDIDEEKLKNALKGNSIKPEAVKNVFDGKSDERILEKILQL